MQDGYHRRHARLVFRTPRRIDLGTLTRQVAGLLELQGQRVESCRVTTDGNAGIETADMVLGLAIGPGNDLSVTVEGPEEADLLHLHVCHKLVSRLAPAEVEWQEPGALVPAAEFLAAVLGKVRPIRPDPCASCHGPVPRTVPALPAVRRAAEAELAGLRAAFRDPSATDREPGAVIGLPSQPARLATWAVSLTVAIFALPVAAALFVLNLAQGEDLRLSAQALALTGLFAALEHAGALTQVAVLLPI